jgi:membrane-associated protein
VIDHLLGALGALPAVVIYLLLAVGAALENVVPLVPADTFVLLGAFLAVRGDADVWTVFLATWLANVTSAYVVYGLARKWGEAFFGHRVGRWLLHPRQLEQIGRFYEKWGVPAIALSRFLPAFRAMVPVFAGVTRLPFRRVAFPLAFASAVWYGALVWAGGFTGRNINAIVDLFNRASGVLAWVAAPLLVALSVWWWFSRHRER